MMSEILMTLDLDEGSTTLRGAQLFPIGEWTHPQGRIKIDFTRAKSFADGFKQKLAGQKLPIFFIHSDKANVSNPLFGKAAGWMMDVRADEDQGVLIDIDFTKEGAEAVRNKSYQYLSAEYFDKIRLPHHDSSHMDVLVGAALVNKPHLKGMQTLLSEDSGGVLIYEESKPDDPEGGGPVDPILLALATSAGLELSDDTTELSADERASIDTYLQEQSGKTKSLEGKIGLLQKKLDDAEGPESKKARNLREAGFEEEAELLSEYRGEKLAKELAAHLPDGSVLTPAVREKVMAYATESDPKYLSEALAIMAEGKGVVSLEEIGSAGSGSDGDTPGGDKSGADDKMLELAEKVAKEKEISLTDAIDLVADEHPELWRQHQLEMGSNKEVLA